ncbi:diguanylate cyclase [Mesobacillus boroniphilus]|uniref:Diguanylate cyclase n=1 Tax=Mesobacillus boroniphilus TaxID=308892 RepID=A0A944CNC7_9BACI|nr:diguanylate cyclase [Mesobacillus boroniphilus]
MHLSKKHTYVFIISLLGILAFMLEIDKLSYSLNDWVTILTLTGAVLLLNHYYIQLPPKGNTLSMDSSVFLASLFLFGLDLTLMVLALHAIIFIFTQRKSEWWENLINFSIYSLMIIFSYQLFILAGGSVGSVSLTNLVPYIVALGIYFLTNTILVGIYFLLAASESLIEVFEGMLKETISTYVSTLLLSIVLLILLDSQGKFGLFLFISISFMLSQAFKQHFELYKDISNKANKDYLTGLNNHGYFKELFEKEISIARESGQPLSVGLLDLDDFKKYNDLYGHIQGDQLLKEFGALLIKESAAKSYTVARYGGEEFSILMPNTVASDAYQFLSDLRKKINDTYFKGVEALPYGCLSFSAGVAQRQNDTYSISELLNKADEAMYFAKAQGKNLVQIYQTQFKSLDDSQSFEKQLEEAEQQLKIFLSKDVYTYRHSKRVFQYAVDFGRKLSLSDHEQRIFTLGALIHDIGKLEIPRDVINKKGKLEPHEWEMVKKHVTWGKEIISTNKELEELIPLVELHHERYDGKGYPYGLQGENIPKLARLLCIVDSFDAMTTERPYQRTKSFDEAIQELRVCAGNQFDSQYVEPFIQMIEERYFLKEGKELALHH